MTIKAAMMFGCEDMTEEQKQEEMVRRIKVVERINKIGAVYAGNTKEIKKRLRGLCMSDGGAME